MSDRIKNWLSLSKSSSTKLNDGANVLLKEYEELLTEIRSIHDKRITYYKILASAVVALVGFMFAGVILYMRSKDGYDYSVPASIVYSYTFVGIALTASTYVLVYGMYSHLGSSKKHTIRYWRAIHSIRLGLKKLYPEISQYLIMPDAEKYPTKPRVSGGWEKAIYIYPLFNFAFAMFAILLLAPLFSEINSEKGILLNKCDAVEFYKAATVIWPFLILSLVVGMAGEMHRFWENLELAKLIRHDNIFPRKSKLYTKDKFSKFFANTIRGIIRIACAVIAIGAFILSSISLLDFFDAGQLLAEKWWRPLLIWSTLLVASLIYVYLATYTLLRAKDN